MDMKSYKCLFVFLLGCFLQRVTSAPEDYNYNSDGNSVDQMNFWENLQNSNENYNNDYSVEESLFEIQERPLEINDRSIVDYDTRNIPFTKSCKVTKTPVKFGKDGYEYVPKSAFNITCSDSSINPLKHEGSIDHKEFCIIRYDRMEPAHGRQLCETVYTQVHVSRKSKYGCWEHERVKLGHGCKCEMGYIYLG